MTKETSQIEEFPVSAEGQPMKSKGRTWPSREAYTSLSLTFDADIAPFIQADVLAMPAEYEVVFDVEPGGRLRKEELSEFIDPRLAGPLDSEP
jgi:hypothetical protein